MTTIALDAMGGDYAPDDIVKGAAWISLDTDINVILQVMKFSPSYHD